MSKTTESLTTLTLAEAISSFEVLAKQGVAVGQLKYMRSSEATAIGVARALAQPKDISLIKYQKYFTSGVVLNDENPIYEVLIHGHGISFDDSSRCVFESYEDLLHSVAFSMFHPSASNQLQICMRYTCSPEEKRFPVARLKNSSGGDILLRKISWMRDWVYISSLTESESPSHLIFPGEKIR